MIATKNLTVFGMLAMVNKALQENPGGDRKEILRGIKKKVSKDSKVSKESKTENLLTNNEIVMKRIIQQAKELINLIDEEVKNRQKFYETHESRWQDSAKGREYLEESEILNEMLNVLNDSICGLKSK